MPKVRVLTAVRATAAGVKGRTLTGVRATATAGGGKVRVLTRVRATATADALMSLTLGPDVGGIEPGTTVTITPVVTNGSGATLSISGPANVPLTGSGPWTYVAPGSADRTGLPLRFTVQATLSGQTVTAEVNHTVYPDTVAYYNAAGQYLSGGTYT